MKVICPECNKNLNIQDEKVPASGSVLVKCPSCQAPISISKEGFESAAGRMPTFNGIPETTPTVVKILDETQNIPVPPPSENAPLSSMLDALEDEMDILEEGASRALVADTDNLELISPAIRKMDFLITAAKDMEETVKKLQFNFYDLIIINERFGGCDPSDNAILKYIEPLNMDIRRKMFVVLIGKNFKTLDNLTAFSKSVNLVLNESDFSNFELILKKSIKDNENFYQVFRKILVDTGREIEF